MTQALIRSVRLASRRVVPRPLTSASYVPPLSQQVPVADLRQADDKGVWLQQDVLHLMPCVAELSGPRSSQRRFGR
jgi:hypothetical protein